MWTPKLDNTNDKVHFISYRVNIIYTLDLKILTNTSMSCLRSMKNKWVFDIEDLDI